MPVAGIPALQGKEVAEKQRRGVLVLDVRPASAFASFHLAASLQIGMDGPFGGWAGLLIPAGQEIILVTDEAASTKEANARLQRIGIDGVIGYLLADEQRWRAQDLDVRSLRTHLAAEVERLRTLQYFETLIDVRSRSEWLRNHLPGAVSMPLHEISERARELTRGGRLLVYCNEGYRATIAASMIALVADADVEIISDGMEAWSHEAQPLEANGAEVVTGSQSGLNAAR